MRTKEEQWKKEFSEKFYLVWPWDQTDEEESSSPWGEPWGWDPFFEYDLEAAPEAAAAAHWEKNKKEIRRLVEEELRMACEEVD